MRPVRVAPALCALLLAACGGTPANQPAATVDPAVVECRAEANRSELVRDAWRAATFNSPAERDRAMARVDDARARAISDCLRSRNVLGGGGVEPVRPRGFF